MADRLEAQLFDGACVRMPTELDYTDPYYLLQFWEQRSDGERDYYSQWTEVVRGASDVLEVVELARRKAAEEAGKPPSRCTRSPRTSAGSASASI